VVLITSARHDHATLLSTVKTGPHWFPSTLPSFTLISLVQSALQRVGSCGSSAVVHLSLGKIIIRKSSDFNFTLSSQRSHAQWFYLEWGLSQKGTFHNAATNNKSIPFT